MKNSHIRHFEAALDHQRAGRFDEAIRACRRILAKAPNNFDVFRLLAILNVQKGNIATASTLFRRAIELNPRDVDVLYNFAVSLSMTGKHDEALDYYRKVLAFTPNHADARNNYAASLLKRERFAEALDQYSALIAARPDLPQAFVNRGIARQNLKRFDEALADYDRAIAIKPDYPEAYLNRGNVLTTLGRADEALASYNRAIALAPDLAAAYNARLHLSDWSSFELHRTQLIDLAKRAPSEYPWGILVLSCSPNEQRDCARIFAERNYPPTAEPLWRGEIYKHERIRVGYLSGDFHQHATAYLMAGLFECHNRAKFEITAISTGPDDKSDMRRRLRHPSNTSSMHNSLMMKRSLQAVRKSEIDILIDLKGFTDGGRTGDSTPARSNSGQLSWFPQHDGRPLHRLSNRQLHYHSGFGAWTLRGKNCLAAEQLPSQRRQTPDYGSFAVAR